MAWDKVCLAFEMGRLGIRKIVFFNQVLLGKLLWRFGHEVSHPWQLLPLNMERARGGGVLRFVGEPMGVDYGEV